MNDLQRCKFVASIKPVAIVDNASYTATAVDTLGASYVTHVVTLGATDIALTALKVQECETSGGSYTDITGATFDAGTNTDGTALSLPSATDDGQVCVFQVKMSGARKRYQKLVVTMGDGAAGGFVAASAILSQLEVAPTADTDIADGGVCRV